MKNLTAIILTLVITSAFWGGREAHLRRNNKARAEVYVAMEGKAKAMEGVMEQMRIKDGHQNVIIGQLKTIVEQEGIAKRQLFKVGALIAYNACVDASTERPDYHKVVAGFEARRLQHVPEMENPLTGILK